MTAIEVTPDRQARLVEWVTTYARGVIDGWAANGEDITTPEAREAAEMVACSMLVPEREVWMELDRALLIRGSVALGLDVDSLDLRDALRTINTATDYEIQHSIAARLGVEPDAVRSPFGDLVSDGRTSLYRHYDAAGALLYVGIANDPDARRGQHQRNSKWAPLSARMDVEWFDTRTEAEAAERAAIRAEVPIFNKTHNKKARDRAIEYLFERIEVAS